ncbi:serine hydrolase [Hyalangium gracile]|uniref:serine hydrolase n=1 Tax=Hyalangium gracile TaxID=394092 RepID=UPI001CCA01EF|nr:serine hydrolase [Hyalangium gracile]
MASRRSRQQETEVRGRREAPRPSTAPRRGRPTRARARAISPALLSTLNKDARELREEFQVPGLAYALVEGDETVALECMGCRRVEETGRCPELKPQPVGADTLFQIGSITKSFTATQLALLVEAGKLEWEAPVRRYLRDFALADAWATREFQVADIVAHRSGLPDRCLGLMAVLGFGRDDVFRALRHVEPVASFRGAYAYQNQFLILAGKLIEQKTEKPWAEALASQLFEPLGMSRSTADPRVVAGMSDVASGHAFIPDETGALKICPIPEDWRYTDALYVDAPAGAIHASVSDMARWMRFHLGKGTFEGTPVLGETGMAYLHTPRTSIRFIPPASAVLYAAGWAYLSAAPRPLLWHDGGTPGMRSFLGLIPDDGVGMVVLTNLGPEPQEDDTQPRMDMAGALFERFYALYLGLEAQAQARWPRLLPANDRPARLASWEQDRETGVLPAALSKLCGTFVNPAYGAFQVKQQGGKLVLRMGPRKIVAPLEHAGGLVFEAVLPGDLLFMLENPRLLVRLVLDKQGNTRELRFLQGAFGDVQQGRFIRRE